VSYVGFDRPNFFRYSAGIYSEGYVAFSEERAFERDAQGSQLSWRPPTRKSLNCWRGA
jgi:hypothetical protein